MSICCAAVVEFFIEHIWDLSIFVQLENGGNFFKGQKVFT